MNKRILTSSLTGLMLGLMFSFSAAAETSVQSNHTAANATATTKTTETTKNEQPKIDNLSASQAEMLQDNISALRMQVMDNEQQNLNWWMTFITIVFAVAGIVIAAIGVVIPLLLYKKEKRQLEEDLAQAKEYVEKIKEHHDSAEKYTQDIAEMKQWNPKEQNQEAQTSSVEKAKQLSKNEEIPLIEQLRAQAILLSDKADQSKSYQDHLQAFYAWQAVLQQNSQDEQANFNSGLQACYLHEKGTREQQIHWFPEIEKYYQKTLIINPYNHNAINNWGNALNNEAQALAAQGDIEAAFKTWHSAKEKFQQALTIKPNMHEAANNWGTALHGEAQALATQGNTATALEKWRDAGEKFQQALAIKPNVHDAAYNWGNALSDEAQALAAQGNTATALEKWREAGEKYRYALDIKPDKHEAANNWGNALHDEAQALAEQGITAAALEKWRHAGEKYRQALTIKPNDDKTTYNWGNTLHGEAQALAAQGNTVAALEKWRDAGEKYRQALAIKPDKHEAAYNWLSCLLHEYHALKDNLPAKSQTKLQQARDLANDFLSKNPQHKEYLAYNHACLYALENNASEAIEQLRLAKDNVNSLGKKRIETDPDFNNIRHTPEFQAWFEEAFPESSSKS